MEIYRPLMHIGLGALKRMLLMITETGFVDESIVLNESQITDLQKYLDLYLCRVYASLSVVM